MQNLIRKIVVQTLDAVFVTVKNAHLENLQKNTPNQKIVEWIQAKFIQQPLLKSEALKILNLD